MKHDLCESVGEALVSGESLSARQRAHLESCAACRELGRSHGLLQDLGRSMRLAEPPREEVGARLLAKVRRRGELFSLTFRRLVWGGLAGGLAILAVLAVFVASAPGPDPAVTGARLLALMDDVDAIAAGDESSGGDSESVELLGFQAASSAEALSSLSRSLDGLDAELDGVLPTGYQALQAVLEDRWL